MSTEAMMCVFVEKMADKGFLSEGENGGAAGPPAKPVFLDDQLGAVQIFMRIEDE